MTKPNDHDDEDEDQDDEPGEETELIDNDRLATILSGTRALVYIPWPSDPSVQVALRPLSREEVLRGASSAKSYVESLGLAGVVVETLVENGRTHTLTWLDLCMRDEWLAISLRHPDHNGKRPLFANAADLRSKLTTDEIDRLYEMLNEHMMKVMPLTVAEKMAQRDQFLKLCEELKKKPETTTLVGCPPAILRELVFFTVNLLPDSLWNSSTTSTSSDS